MAKSATFEPEHGLSHVRRLKFVMGDDDWRERGTAPDWAYIENEDGERVYIYARHTLYLTAAESQNSDLSEAPIG